MKDLISSWKRKMEKKNSQIHFVLKTSLKELLEKEAKLEEISLAELCREKLRHNSRLVRIEFMLEKLNKKLTDGK